jgi:hypothetical protein
MKKPFLIIKEKNFSNRECNSELETDAAQTHIFNINKHKERKNKKIKSNTIKSVYKNTTSRPKMGTIIPNFLNDRDYINYNILVSNNNKSFECKSPII